MYIVKGEHIMLAINRLLLIVCSFIGLLSLSDARAAEVQDIVWSSNNTATHRFVVLPGKFAELCGRVKAGEEISWQFDATHEMNFNIHYHAVDKKVVEPVSLSKVQQTNGSITASSDEDYCWMWTNTSKSQPARLEVKLEKRVPG